ncbi:prolyl oligopeptidase family serine peptidase, partial [Phenylobacterium sp.]|uniref:alpha/beta hydrolase family protein n=1 Tax=Phenylobacterium sp. TaxID=1871053 RepID=UPI0025FC9AF3
AAIDTGVYRCAASYGGVSDLKRMVAWSKVRSEAAFRYWIRFMGADDGKDQILTDLSPAARGDKVNVPVLLIHGRDDSVVPLEQSQIMADALKKAGRPVEFVVLKGEDHWLSRGETRIQTLAAMIAFLEKNNPPN